MKIEIVRKNTSKIAVTQTKHIFKKIGRKTNGVREKRNLFYGTNMQPKYIA
jgi:hypothetical protein